MYCPTQDHFLLVSSQDGLRSRLSSSETTLLAIDNEIRRETPELSIIRLVTENCQRESKNNGVRDWREIMRQ